MLDNLRRVVQEVNAAENLDDALLIIVREIKSTMGVDVCYTNHAEADQDDMDNLLTLLGVAGCNFIMGVPGGDDIMLNYQTSAFHDALYLRRVLDRQPAPEFAHWLKQMGIIGSQKS